MTEPSEAQRTADQLIEDTIGPLSEFGMTACCQAAGWDFKVLRPEAKDVEWLIRLDTTDPDVHLVRKHDVGYAVAVLHFPLMDGDRDLLRRLDPARRDLAAAKLLRGLATLGVQWKIEDEDGIWTGFQISTRVYAGHVMPGELWDRVESVVDGGFMVRATLLELRSENGVPATPAPYPRRRAVEIVDGVPDYIVVHTSKEAARWIHDHAERWQVSTEAVVDRLVASERGKPLKPDPAT